ncbi:DNA repair protein RadC [candidate division KSB1 bacterium]|nr:DNA repair protein RadC [candidate division KSB1 bacterium]
MKRYTTKIKDWPEEERPRERLKKYGAASLSDAELLAIILRTGSGELTAVELARQVLKKFNGLRGLDSGHFNVLCDIKGIGLAKAAQIKASLEISKRIAGQKWQDRPRIENADDVYQLMKQRLRDLGREEFCVMFLTLRMDVICDKSLFLGSLAESVVDAREIILEALHQSAANIILLHNHPSGDPNPSVEDRQVTQKIVEACKYFDIHVLDHIIIGKDKYYSFADEGLIKN